MYSGLMNAIAIDVEITTTFGSGGYSIFSPENPFIKRNDWKPLPWWDCKNKFDLSNTNNRELRWVIEEELTFTPPALDLKKAFNCFNKVPSLGAKYSLKLCVDVPDNSNPTNVPPQTGSETGHTFIVLTKTNGSSSVTQVFGFYASKHPGYFFPFRPVDSAIRNNQLREINASIKMDITDAQFELFRKKSLELAMHKYAAAMFNCTNFGLDDFNCVRVKPITIDSYTFYLPNDNSMTLIAADPDKIIVNKTPQMLFKKLKEMKDHNDPEAPNIIIDQSGATKAPLSHGECD